MSDQLPTPTEADGAALFEAHQVGRAEMCLVDEAEIRAIGFTPVGRGEGIAPFPQAGAGFDDPVVVAAGARLVARGLALAAPTDHWAVQASGPLLAWFVGHVLPANGSFVVNIARTPVGEVERGRRRVTLIGGSGMSLVEYVDVPPAAGDAPLPVRIDAVRADVLVGELVEEVFRPLDGERQLTLDLVTTAAHGPARIVADHEVVGMETRGHGLRKSSTRMRKLTPGVFRAYVEGMITALNR